MRDNSNPKAHIAILVPYQFFFHAFRSVYDNLPQAEFVPDFSLTPGGLSYPDHYKDSFKKLFANENVSWRDFETSGLTPGEFFDKYSTIVTPIVDGWTKHQCNKNRKKVRISYGTAKDSWAYGLYNAQFDLILCPGEHAARNLELYSSYGTKVVPVGEPKLDDLARKKDRGILLKKTGLQLDQSKETVLFLPTWGSLSSISHVAPLLPSLLKEYNVVVKVHHMTGLYSQQEVEMIRHPSIHVAGEELYVTDAFRIADIVISDSSSGIFDAIAAGKPLVLIDSLGGEDSEFFIEMPFFAMHHGKLGGSPTHKDSLEQVVKRPGKEIAPVVTIESRTTRMLKSATESLLQAIRLAKEPIFIKKQQEMKAKIFSSLDGKAGMRAAQEIQELLKHPTERDRTLERFVDEYEHRTLIAMDRAALKNAELVQRFQTIRKLPYIERIRAVVKEFFD